MKAPAAARCLATRAASFSGRPFSWARTPRSSSMPVMCSGRSGPSYAAWSAVRASFSCARSRGPRCWAPAGRLPLVGLPPDGPRPPDLPRVSPDRLPPRESPRESLRDPPRESPREPPRESLCDPPRDDELPRPLPDEPPRPPPDPPRDGPCPRRSSATAALPFSTPRHPVRGQRYSYRARNGAGATRSLVAPAKCLSGGVLLSHNLSVAVPSALKGLTSGFGMGPGVSRFAMAAVTLSTSSNPRGMSPWDGFVGWELLSGREQECVSVCSLVCAVVRARTRGVRVWFCTWLGQALGLLVPVG